MKIIFSSKRHHYVARASTFLIVVALIAGMVGCDGTPSSVEIWDWYDLDAVRDNLDGDYTLMNDLDSTTAGYTELASPTANEGKGWEPIGTYDDSFTGTFDGQGYEIQDLFIDRPAEEGIGLFTWVGKGGVVKNVGVVEAAVAGFAAVGGLIGYIEGGTVSDCHFTGSVTGDIYGVGGLVGGGSGTVSDSYSTGSVTGYESVGGLVGENWGTVSNSYSTGSVTGEMDGVGGLVGENGGTVSNSYSSANVTGDLYVGGLVGANYYAGILSECYSTGSVTGERYGAGGLVGFNYRGTVSNSHYNYDEVLINGENIISIGALFGEDFEQWLANGKFLDVDERLSQESGYYLINDVNDFKELLAFGQDSSLKFRLKSDLDLAIEPNFYVPYLAGEFDGNGHKISNLSFNSDFVSHVGLFGYLALGGRITQVGVENVNITGASSVGGLVGGNGGTVSNSYSTGSVTGGNDVGGLAGGNWEGTVGNSYSTSSVAGDSRVGGLVGGNDATVSNSYSTGSVTGEYSVGGLVGYNDFDILSDSYATGNVTGGDLVGGLVGFNGPTGTVSDSYATGSVTGDWDVGGLVGGNDGTVSNSYSTGSVTGSENVGGLVGSNEHGTVSNSFWDTVTSGQSTSVGGTGKNTTEMQDIATFDGVGWDITAVDPGETDDAYTWNIVDTVTYPFLSWQP